MTGTTVDFYYYSGTGNTLLAVKKMAEVFSKKGTAVTLHKIEHSAPPAVERGHTLGLAFPVAFQSTFPFLWSFFRSLPETNGTPVFMLDTMMSFSGAIVGPLKRVLTKKGYDCIGACEIKMPNNWLPKTVDHAKNKAIVACGLKRAEEYAEELLEGKSDWKRIPLLSQSFYYICCNDFVMDKLILPEGRKIAVDTGKCIKCGLCAKLCPVNNITIENYPLFHDSCELCMRCISFCPVKAIYIPGKKFEQYRAVKAQELLK